MEESEQRARDIFILAGNEQTEELVGTCSICLEWRNANPKEPMISHPVPERPWQTIGTDLFIWNGADYIVAVDYYSRFF